MPQEIIKKYESVNPKSLYQSCAHCGKKFIPRRYWQKLCGDPACLTEQKRDLTKEWRRTHQSEYAAYQKNYRETEQKLQREKEMAIAK